MIRVGLPPPLDLLNARLFRSAERVWVNVAANLPSDDVVVVDEGPDVLLWDVYRELDDQDTPLVGIIHEAPAEGQGVADRFLEHLDRVGNAFCERASRVVTCSTHSALGIAERYGIDRSRIDVAPYGVDAPFGPEGPDAAAALAAAGGDGRPYVLFVGAVLPRKNLPLLRGAMAQLPTHQLVLVAGPCVDERSSELLAEATTPIDGRAVPNLLGIKDEQLAGLMRGAAALCLPSVSEGFGLPVAEAMACGTPVVVSDRGSLPELVGEAGVVVAPEESALVDGLQTAIDQRDALSERSLRRGGELRWSRTSELVRQSIRRVAGADGGP